jgi:hypothetical protein
MEEKQKLKLEECVEKTEEILKEVKVLKEPEEIQKILPSWSLLNRLHRAVSSLLELRQ